MKNILFIAFVLLSITTIVAQPGPGPITAPPTPIDGGIGLLLAAGAALGYKKYKAKTQKNEL